MLDVGLITHPYTSHNQLNWGITIPPSLKSLASSLGSTLWSSVSDPTQGYRVDYDTICNDQRKNTSNICTIPQKD